MIDGTGRRPIEERSGAKTFMLDDHVQTNLCTNASAPAWWFERKDELEALSKERCPLYVYDDETLNETVSFLAGLSGHFQEASVFSFGNGIGVSIKPWQEIPDFPATKDSLEAVKDMYPKFGFWLIPGDRIVSHAGVLLTKVTETHQIEGNYCVRINAGMEVLVRSALYGRHHEIVNFSKLGEKETRLTHIIGIEGGPDNTICCVKRLAPVEKGDILLITNTGACGSDQGLALQALEAEHHHYLRARKMCSVKI